jgi:hypothetical protein
MGQTVGGLDENFAAMIVRDAEGSEQLTVIVDFGC